MQKNLFVGTEINLVLDFKNSVRITDFDNMSFRLSAQMKKWDINQLTPGPSLHEERGDRPELGRRGESN